MSGSQELAVREKQELARQEEKTTPGRYYVPATDIFETDEALTLIMEMPGVKRNNEDRSRIDQRPAGGGRADTDFAESKGGDAATHRGKLT